MELGAVGKGCANVPFTGAVTMSLVPRGSWRRVVLKENGKAILLQFKLRTLDQTVDFSAVVADLEASIPRKVRASV